MTGLKTPHYAVKHPAGTEMDEEIAQAIRTRADNEKLSCDAAFEIVETLAVSPVAVGVVADLLETRLVHCDLGLFGYSHGGRSKPTVTLSPQRLADLEPEIRKVMESNQITCAATWRVAAALSVPRHWVAAACDHLSIKIARCQLGAF